MVARNHLAIGTLLALAILGIDFATGRKIAAIEVLGFCLYVLLIRKLAEHARQMRMTITTQQDEMQHLRTFARMAGTTLQGRGVSPGLADGTAVLYLPDLHATMGQRRILREEVKSQVHRIDRAILASINELTDLRKRLQVGRTHEEIALVDAHAAMLNDPSFVQACKRRISEDLVTAESAVVAETHLLEQKIQGHKQEFIRARAADVRDIGLQILNKLETSHKGNAPRTAFLPPGSVVVAEELLLSDALKMNTADVLAIVTEKTGPASHVAMLARARGIPAVCDIDGVTSMLSNGDYLLVDAEAGTVTVAPTPAQATRFTLRKSQTVSSTCATSQESVLPSVTKDGVEITLHANIGRPDEAIIVLEHELHGVGLFRSEYLFLDGERPPDLEAQTAAYSEVAAMLNPRPVVIRTIDFGGDKMPRFSGMTRGSPKSAGLRGLAYALAETTIFRTQIIAIVRAAQRGDVRMMFPMVVGPAELMEARCLVDEVMQHECPGKDISIGAMIETPAAVVDISRILELVDFVSIGTNDLAHCILAMNRGSEGPAGVISFFHPSVLRATFQVVQAAGRKGVHLSVCGEAASDPTAACLLIGMGVRNLSINPLLAHRVRRAIREVTVEKLQHLAREVLNATTERQSQDLLTRELTALSQQPVDEVRRL